jgi:hypothetical protein
VVALALLLIDGTRWIWIFPALVAVILLWIGQAIHAHRLAVGMGAARGGEMQLAWMLPVVLAVVTAFWLLAGDHGSPAAVLQEYVVAWRGGHVEAAASLFMQRPDRDELSVSWSAQRQYLVEQVGAAASTYGPASGLDPADAFASLRFLELAAERTTDSTVVTVDIVRRQRVETSLFGIIPTATQETVLVERAGRIELRAVPAELPSWLTAVQPPARVWRIEQVRLPL